MPEPNSEQGEAGASVRVFPLPNVVFFPHATLALHVFEPRYRAMVEEALAAERRIAVALLKPGWEEDYYGNPPVHSVACVGAIDEHRRLPDGRFNIRLRGVARIEIVRFLRTSPYRVARFRVLEDRNVEEGPAVREARERLLKTCAGLLQAIGGGRPLSLPDDLPFDVGVNALCQNLAMETERRQALLEVDDVVERCRMLIEILAARWRETALGESGPTTTH